MRNAGEISYVVDDEACVRDAVCAMLESAEIEVMGFDSAAAAFYGRTVCLPS